MLSSHVCDVCETREGFGSEAVCVKWYDPPALGELHYVTWVSHLHMRDELCDSFATLCLLHTVTYLRDQVLRSRLICVS